MINAFDESSLKRLFKPDKKSAGEDNGLVTIVGGSELFHGAPLLSLKVASRIVDMVFFATPEKSVGHVAEKIKSNLLSFIWVPWKEVDAYIKKSDAILIGPGFMRYRSEKVPKGERYHVCDNVCEESRGITKHLLDKFLDKNWVIDAGSLQVIDPEWIPKNAILTPNKKEYEFLFGNLSVEDAASRYGCTIVSKGPKTLVCSPDECVEVSGGNPGLTKGGSGDVLAGLTAALFAKNESFLAASSSSFIIKKAADEIYEELGPHYNADDLADKIPQVLNRLQK